MTTAIDYRSVRLRYLLEEIGPVLLRAAALDGWHFGGARADGPGRVRFRLWHAGVQAALVVRYLDAQTDVEADPALRPALAPLVPLVERVAELAHLPRDEGAAALRALQVELVGPDLCAAPRDG